MVCEFQVLLPGARAELVQQIGHRDRPHAGFGLLDFDESHHARGDLRLESLHRPGSVAEEVRLHVPGIDHIDPERSLPDVELRHSTGGPSDWSVRPRERLRWRGGPEEAYIPIGRLLGLAKMEKVVRRSFGQCGDQGIDRKSTRLNSSHLVISYAVFCL